MVINGYFTMLKKNTLCTLILLCTSSVYANVPIESKGLSNQNYTFVSPTAIPVTNTSATADVVPTNLNWQLTQKTQQLENDIRSLRGKIEEQDYEINQLKNELNNRYTDLDQRLELLLQKLEAENTEDATSEEDNQQDNTPSSNSTNSDSTN